MKTGPSEVEITDGLLKEFLGSPVLVKCHGHSYCGRLAGFSLTDSRSRKGPRWWLGVEFGFIAEVTERKGRVVSLQWHKYGYTMDFGLPEKGKVVNERLVITTDLKEILVLTNKD